MPEKAMKNGQEVKVGSFVECKWGKKFYEAQVLKLSGEFILIVILNLRNVHAAAP